ncbi:alpha/beta hydrolase [Curtobacterium pusillum]|uniref:alpha/beta hydrolase n=1 Tax=Curtobacterium pusillum TaxID=69373 RepID=UPI0011A9C97F|nr:alpha/beta hydrolase [Curtobacterium pusillum]
MLLIAAALLTASMHSLGVVEAPGAPAAHSVSVVAASAVVPGADSVPRPVMTGVQVTVEDVAAAHGRTFLDDLAALGRSDLADAGRDPRVVATAQDDPPTAAEVDTWWTGLDDDERRTLVTFAPSVVGNLEGVPYAVRDRANRAVLAAGLADDAAGAARTAMLGQVRDSLVHAVGAPARSLITLDTRGSGRAAIAIGDLDTAADVTVVVPGMFFTVTGQMTDFTNTANDLYSEQATLAGVAAPGSGSGVAVVAWMGYRTPDLSNILSLGLAKTGATRLEHTVGGLREIRDGDQPRLNIVAHSYGSTAALMALSSGRMSADTLTVLGSPGSDVPTSADLAVSAGQVFVGDAHSDPIAGSGYFGTDPGSSSFGSTLLDLAGGADAADAGDVFRRPIGHNDYLKPGTASLHDVALIAVGRGDLVREQVRRGEGGDDGLPQASPDMYLVRPQDLQPRD